MPAYAAFLPSTASTRRRRHASTTSQRLPLVTKQNYLTRTRWRELCRGGTLDAATWSPSRRARPASRPFWPRSLSDELPIARRFEQVFHDSFRADQRRTLAVVCFALGTWVGGMYTAACCRHLAAKGYPITVVTPGQQRRRDPARRARARAALRAGRPARLSAVPQGRDRRRPGRRASTGRATRQAGDGRRGVQRGVAHAGRPSALGSTEPLLDSASLYGTADAGVLGNETPLSVAHPPLPRRAPRRRARAVRRVAPADAGPVRPARRATSRCRRRDAAVLRRQRHAAGPLPHRRRGRARRLRATCSRSCASTASTRCRGAARRAIAACGRCRSSTSSAAPTSPSPTSAPTSTPRTSPSAWSSRRSTEWVTGKFVLQAREDDDRDRYLSIVVELAPGVDAEPRDGADAIAESILRAAAAAQQRVRPLRPRRAPAAARRAGAARATPTYFPSASSTATPADEAAERGGGAACVRRLRRCRECPGARLDHPSRAEARVVVFPELSLTGYELDALAMSETTPV